MKKLYDNYKIISKEGIEMFFCNSKKFNWYLKKKLVTKISEDTAKLNFNPKDYGDNNNLNKKNNLCIVCGTEHNLTKHHIVPLSFKKFMPDKYKNHNSYDILPVCNECHIKYEIYANDYKKMLYDIHTHDLEIFNKKLKKAKKIISRLEKYNNLLKDNKKQEYNTLLKELMFDLELNLDEIKVKDIKK